MRYLCLTQNVVLFQIANTIWQQLVIMLIEPHVS